MWTNCRSTNQGVSSLGRHELLKQRRSKLHILYQSNRTMTAYHEILSYSKNKSRVCSVTTKTMLHQLNPVLRTYDVINQSPMKCNTEMEWKLSNKKKTKKQDIQHINSIAITRTFSSKMQTNEDENSDIEGIQQLHGDKHKLSAQMQITSAIKPMHRTKSTHKSRCFQLRQTLNDRNSKLTETNQHFIPLNTLQDKIPWKILDCSKNSHLFLCANSITTPHQLHQRKNPKNQKKQYKTKNESIQLKTL